MSRASRGDRYLTAEERDAERLAAIRPADLRPRVPKEVAQHPARSFIGRERAPDPQRADERGAVSVLEPVFADYRLGFFPLSVGGFEARRLPNRAEVSQ